jgi:hypothetical protein
MAAGLGFKTFTTGEVLTAADTNGYLMQGINVFASTAARDAAITSPQEGQFAFTKDTNGLWYYDGAAWVASGATGDIEGVTAGVGITGGGTSGTVTITNDMATTITAAGDIVVGTGSGTYDNLPIGTTAQVLTADTTVSPYKVKWATPAGSSLTIAQIASGSLSTISTQVTGLSAYDSLTIYIEPSFSVYANDLTFGFNNTITNTDYTYNGDAGTGHNTGAWVAMPSINTPASYAAITITLTNCKAAGFTNFQAVARFTVSSTIRYYTFSGIYKSAAAISSIEMKASSGTMSGSYVVWGG